MVNRRILIAGNLNVTPLVFHIWRRSERKGHHTDVRCARYDEGRGLGNVLSEHELVLYLLVYARLLHCGNGSLSVRGVLRVSNGNFPYAWIEKCLQAGI